MKIMTKSFDEYRYYYNKNNRLKMGIVINNIQNIGNKNDDNINLIPGNKMNREMISRNIW